MAPIPGGTFTMGSNDGSDDELPAHRVNGAAFEIDKLPVTNAQFAEFLQPAGTHNRRGERLFDYDDSDAPSKTVQRLAPRRAGDTRHVAYQRQHAVQLIEIIDLDGQQHTRCRIAAYAVGCSDVDTLARQCLCDVPQQACAVIRLDHNIDRKRLIS